jgi:16S rRNA G966 N2-methylase RsmD
MTAPTDDWISPADKHPEDVLTSDWNKLLKAIPKTIVSCHNREGMKLLEHFQPHFWETESETGDSIAKLWNNAEIRAKALERTEKHYDKIYKSEIRRNLAFFSKAPLPTMYRPLLTKGIVSSTNAKKVLDPCIGWGGRMIGTLSLPDTHFTGCDPSTKTYNGLYEIAELCKIVDRATLFNDGAEVVLPTLPSGEYDLVLTSPPYFTLEIYADEESQSVKKHSTYKEWVDNWLEVVIKECLRCLKPDGISAWSVKNMKKYKLQDDVFRIHEKYGYKLTTTYGMGSTTRNQGGGTKITEETFLFKKQ